MTLTFAQYPQLQSAGGSVTITIGGYSDPLCGNNQVVVICQSPGTYVALAPSCDHACCTATFSGSGFRCPCHGARWDASGNLTQGPARSNLPSLQVCADSAGVHVSY